MYAASTDTAPATTAATHASAGPPCGAAAGPPCSPSSVRRAAGGGPCRLRSGRRGVAEQVVAPLAGGQSLRVLAEGASRQARWARCGERSGETGCRAHRTRVTRTLKLKDPEADRAGSWRSGIVPAARWSISVCSGDRVRATCRKNVVAPNERTLLDNAPALGAPLLRSGGAATQRER